MGDVSVALIYGAGHDEAENGPSELVVPLLASELPAPLPRQTQVEVASSEPPAWDSGPNVPSFRPLDQQTDKTSDDSSAPPPLRTISPCIPNSRSRDLVSLTARRMFWALMGVALLLTVTLGRVHLRFSTEDLKTQHVRLQTMRRGLERQVVLLENRSSDCWDSDMVQEIIEQKSSRRFVSVEHAALSAVTLPKELREKYLDHAVAASAVAKADREHAERSTVLTGMMELLEAGKAYTATRY